jgi:hypothetical protein
MNKCHNCSRKVANVHSHIVRGHCKGRPLVPTTPVQSVDASSRQASTVKKRKLVFEEDGDDPLRDEYYATVGDSNLLLMTPSSTAAAVTGPSQHCSTRTGGEDEHSPSMIDRDADILCSLYDDLNLDDASLPRVFRAQRESDAKDKLKREEAAIYNQIGLSNVFEFEFVSLLTKFNLSQAAVDAVLQMIRHCVSDANSFQLAKKLPKSTAAFYKKVDDNLEANIDEGSGIRLHTASVKLPDLECFTSNGLSHVDITYLDPEYFFQSLPARYTMEDLILPSDEHVAKFPTEGINDFHTCQKTLTLTREIRAANPTVPNLHVLTFAPHDDATPVSHGVGGSVTPWSFVIGTLKREIRERDAGRYFAGYLPEFRELEFVGSDESEKEMGRLMTLLTDAFFLKLFRKAGRDRIIPLRFKKTRFDDVLNQEYVTINFIVKPLLQLGDYPALQRKCSMKETTHGLAPCRRCTIPHDKLWETALDAYPRRNYKKESEMRLQFRNNQGRGREETRLRMEAKEYLHAHSLFPHFPGLHAWYGCDTSDDHAGFGLHPERDCMFETMHELELGPMKDIVDFLNEILENKNSKFDDILNISDTVTPKMLRELLSKRIALFHSARLDEEGDSYLSTFRNGASDLSFLTAKQFKHLHQMYALALGDCTEFFKPEYASQMLTLLNRTWMIGQMIFDKEKDWSE